ncbi:hypothetical protein HPC38_06630 [Pasteurellaceae bacterium HPA106]|nr:hypothetical protein [Spirabiliibacterium pneumoniae]MBE2896549.1 hypothetical protein [Spirabiliibacterium pneumoniae]
MPVQKLTKARIIQIVIALLILISAFLYRTYHNPYTQSAVQTEQSE